VLFEAHKPKKVPDIDFGNRWKNYKPDYKPKRSDHD
jgi:hypothetical protein